MAHSTAFRHVYLIAMLLLTCQQVAYAEADPATHSGIEAEHTAREQERVRTTTKIVLFDDTRNRSIPLRITIPIDPTPCPLIIWSHDQAGTRNDYSELIAHWAENRYACIQPTHIAAKSTVDTTREWLDRVADIAFILDSLENIKQRHRSLAEVIDESRIGVGGHEAGAHAAQIISGAALDPAVMGPYQSKRDDRPLAFVFLSPVGASADTAFTSSSFDSITRPALSITGTNVTPTDVDWRWRLELFKQSPPKNKFVLFIENAKLDFSVTTNKSVSDRDHMECVKIGTVKFWDAYFKNDRVAKKFLKSNNMSELSAGTVQLLAASREKQIAPFTNIQRPIDRPSKSAKATAQATILTYDKNKDGVLSRDEMPSQLLIGFDLYDQDQSGKISPEELNWGLQRTTISTSVDSE